MTQPYGDYLSRKRIAKVALAIVDEEGLDALTTRRVAKEIGVTSPALYHHFGSKADLLDEVIRAALREVYEPDRSATWTQQVIEMATSYRRALTAHPNLVPAMVTHPWRRFASSLAIGTARSMAQEGVPAELIPVIISSVEMFTYGAALSSTADDDQPLPAEMPELDAYPDVAAALVREADAEAVFGAGLKALISGWEHRLAMPAR